MPSHISIRKVDQLKPKPHHKKIVKKELKIERQRSSLSAGDSDFAEENTMSETIIEELQNEGLSTLKEVGYMLKLAVLRFRYSLDTYYVCLSLLGKIKFQICPKKARLISAAVILIAGKVHEFRTPKFIDLLNWGEHQFGSTDLVKAEAELLMLFSFRVPVVFVLKNMKQLQQQIIRLEKNLFQSQINFQ